VVVFSFHKISTPLYCWTVLGWLPFPESLHVGQQTAKFALSLRVALKLSNWEDVTSILTNSDDSELASKYVGDEVSEAQQAWKNATALELLVEALSHDEGRLSEAPYGPNMNVMSVDLLDVAIDAASDATSQTVTCLKRVAEGVRNLRLAVLNKDWHSIAAALEIAESYDCGIDGITREIELGRQYLQLCDSEPSLIDVLASISVATLAENIEDLREALTQVLSWWYCWASW
jgi:hypothetical protein